MRRLSTPILCRAYSKNNDDSCVGYRSRSERSAWGTWSTGRAFRRCADAYVQSGDACAWTLLDTPHICRAFALKHLSVSVLCSLIINFLGGKYNNPRQKIPHCIKISRLDKKSLDKKRFRNVDNSNLQSFYK